MIMYKFNYNKLGIKRNVNINVTGKYYLNLYVFVLTFSAADSTSREGGDSISMRTVTPVHQSGPKPRGKFLINPHGSLLLTLFQNLHAGN